MAIDKKKAQIKEIKENCHDLLERSPDSHKGDFGHVLVVGGDHGMAGAAIMAAEAAYRSGAGKVSVLTREEHFSALMSRLPSAMTVPKHHHMDEILDGKSAIIIGPGLGKSDWSRRLLEVTIKSDIFTIVDADALNIISEHPENFDLKNCIITPHVGEASLLLNKTAGEIQKDRDKAVIELYEKFKTVAVLKGKGSLVYGPKKVIHKSELGNPGMSVAGMGDALSGIIAALVSQNLEFEIAAFLGVKIHAFAADLVAEKQGIVGMTPIDLLPYIPLIINGKI